MHRSGSSLIAAILGFAVAIFAGDAFSQSQKQQLIGVWSFVSSTNPAPGGGPIWGTNPKGMLIFTDNGHFAVQIMRGDRAPFASNNRMTGTAEEYKAAIQGILTYFGTYTVDDAAKTFTYHMEMSSYPNWNGHDQTRSFDVNGDELKYRNPAPSSGGGPAELAWRRVK